MAVRSKALRSRRASAARATGTDHLGQRVRAAIGIFLFMAAFGWLWIIGGNYTAIAFVAALGWTIEAGWAAHVIITAVELLPLFVLPFVPVAHRAKARMVLLVLCLPFGVLDVLSNALGLQVDLLGSNYGLQWNAAATLLGSIVAHAPERTIWYLFGLLGYVWKGKHNE